MSHTRMPMQSMDGYAHLTYFDKGTQLSFVWSGDLSEPVEVCHGGYGEPVVDTFVLTCADVVREDGTALAQAVINSYQEACERYVAHQEARSA